MPEQPVMIADPNDASATIPKVDADGAPLCVDADAADPTAEFVCTTQAAAEQTTMMPKMGMDSILFYSLLGLAVLVTLALLWWGFSPSTQSYTPSYAPIASYTPSRSAGRARSSRSKSPRKSPSKKRGKKKGGKKRR